MSTIAQTSESHAAYESPSVRVTMIQLLLCALLLSPTLGYRIGLDQGIFAYIGDRMLDGFLPYRDTWDHAFPGVMLIHAFELLLFGKSIFMFRVFDLFWQLATVFFLFRISMRLSGLPGAFLAVSLYCLIYQGYGPWNTAQREGFAMLPVLWGFWLYLSADRRNRLLTFAGIGFGLGLAVLIKPTMLALAGLYVPLLLRMRRSNLPGLLLAFFLLLLPTVITCAVYAYLGALRDLYEACIRYQTEAYLHINSGSDSLLEYWWSKFRRLGGTTLVLTFGFLPILWLSRLRMEYLMLYLGFLGTVYAVFVQGTFAGYHYLPGLALGAIMMGAIFSEVSARVLGDRRIRIGNLPLRLDALLAGLLVVAVFIPHYVRIDAVSNLLSLRYLDPPYPNEYRNRTVFDFTESWDTGQYLREHTQPDERIQVWGHESIVYYFAERNAASRFQTSNPLVVHGPGKPLSKLQQGWRTEFMRAMHDRPPVYIAVVHDDHWWWAPEEKSSREVLDEFPEWEHFILDNYFSETRIGRFELFRLDR